MPFLFSNKKVGKKIELKFDCLGNEKKKKKAANLDDKWGQTGVLTTDGSETVCICLYFLLAFN